MQNEAAIAVVTGTPVTAQVYMVTVGEYDDYKVIMVCADERRAQDEADALNRARSRRLYAQVEAVNFIPANGR